MEAFHTHFVSDGKNPLSSGYGFNWPKRLFSPHKNTQLAKMTKTMAAYGFHTARTLIDIISLSLSHPEE